MPKSAPRGNVVVLVTCGTRSEARALAGELVARRLAACVNIVEAPLRSVYRWKGKIEHAREFLLIVKTSRRRLRGLRSAVEALHSYEVPELIALPIAGGSPAYLRWLNDSL